MVPPGTYPCQWSYRDEAVAGELSFEPSSRPAGELFNASGIWVDHENSKSFSPHVDRVEIVRGWTRRGDDIALLGAQIRHVFPERSLVQAELGLVGHDLPEDLLFPSVEFQVGGLTELSGVRPLKHVSMPKTLDGDPKIAATWNSEGTRQRWMTSDGDELELNYDANMSWNEFYGLSVTAAPVVTVAGVPRSAEEWMRRYVRPMAEITTLATQHSQTISWVCLGRAQGRFPVQVIAADIAQQPYDASPPEHDALITHGSGTLFRLGGEGAASLPDLFERWAHLRSTHGTFFDYLTVAMRNTLSTRSRFLALVPALEGLHLARYGDGPVPRNAFQKMRKAVIKRLSVIENVESDDIAFLKEWLAPYGSYQLAYRLREIFEKEIGPDLNGQIRARVDPLPDSLVGFVEGVEDVWAVMGTARNRIAHGAEIQPSSAQLGVLTRLAHTITVGAALRILGVSDAVLCESINQDRWQVC